MLPETMNPRRLTIVLILFALVILLGILFSHRPALSYELTPEQSLYDIVLGKARLGMGTARQAVQKNDPSYVFIDIRDPYEFLNGHIPGALNINLQEMASKNTVKKLREYQDDAVKVVIYGNDESSANGIVQLLRQTGFSNVLCLEGGFHCFHKGKETTHKASVCSENAEARHYDYASFLKKDTTAVQGKQVTRESPKSLKPKRATASRGRTEGC